MLSWGDEALPLSGPQPEKGKFGTFTYVPTTYLTLLRTPGIDHSHHHYLYGCRLEWVVRWSLFLSHMGGGAS